MNLLSHRSPHLFYLQTPLRTDASDLLTLFILNSLNNAVSTTALSKLLLTVLLSLP